MLSTVPVSSTSSNDNVSDDARKQLVELVSDRISERQIQADIDLETYLAKYPGQAYEDRWSELLQFALHSCAYDDRYYRCRVIGAFLADGTLERRGQEYEQVNATITTIGIPCKSGLVHSCTHATALSSHLNHWKRHH